MKKIIVLLGVGIMLFGCAQPQVWVRPNYTEQEFNVDKYQCMKEAMAVSGQQSHMAYGSMTFVLMSNAFAQDRANKAVQAMFDACMQSKGWMKQEKAPKSVSTETEKPMTLTPITPSPGTTKIFTWTFGNIRSGAGNEFPIVTTVKQGDRLTVVGERGEWFNVQLEDGKEGWISNKAFLPLISQLSPLIATREEVEQFLANYTERYTQKDLDSFISLFSSRAVQNRKNGFKEISTIYSNYFNQSQEIRYQMEDTKIEIYHNEVEVKARYEVDQVLKKGREKKVWKGDIHLVLVKENGALKIISLDFQH